MQEVVDAARGIGRAGNRGQLVRVIEADDARVGRDDDSTRRVENVRQRVERNEARPLTIVRRPIVREFTAAGFPDWETPRAVITDMALGVGVNHIEGGA